MIPPKYRAVEVEFIEQGDYLSSYEGGGPEKAAPENGILATFYTSDTPSSSHPKETVFIPASIITSKMISLGVDEEELEPVADTKVIADEGDHSQEEW